MRTIFGLLIIIATLCIIPTLDLVFAAETTGEYIDRKAEICGREQFQKGILHRGH